MTKREALEQCILLWKYISEHTAEFHAAAASKYIHARRLLGYRPYNGCPACEYDTQFDGICVNCPISGWSNDRCFLSGSEYNRWLSALTEHERTAAAKDILRLAQQSLNALGDE